MTKIRDVVVFFILLIAPTFLLAGKGIVLTDEEEAIVESAFSAYDAPDTYTEEERSKIYQKVISTFPQSMLVKIVEHGRYLLTLDDKDIRKERVLKELPFYESVLSQFEAQ